MKNMVLRWARRRMFQNAWGRIYRTSIIGQNYWSSTVDQSGELYALEIAEKALRLQKDICIFDVGANIGQFAFAAADRFRNPKIYSFEPSRKTYESLLARIEAKGLNDIVIAHNTGLSDSEGSVLLYSSHEDASIASMHNLHNPPKAFNEAFSEVVNTATLDAFCLESKIEKIDYLKIDVEGHELSVLCGAARLIKNGGIRYIQFEFGEANIDSRTYVRDFFELLSCDYNFYRIVSDGIHFVPEYHASLEVFATINYLAVRKSYDAPYSSIYPRDN